MDTENLIKEAKARFSHNSAKAYLSDKYQSKLSVAEQGGLWKVTPELIVFLDSTVLEEMILVDSFGNPVKVNRQQLLVKVRDTYNNVMEQWYNEYKELENKR
jgi:hypothetical protein